MAIPSPERLEALAVDIRDELAQLTRLVNGATHVLEGARNEEADTEVFYESLALKLQSFYTGCERIFQLVADELNGGLPPGSEWHRRLLLRARAAQRARPAIISDATARALEPYLGFRHVVRNAYTFELDARRVDVLAEGLPRTFDLFTQDMQRFLNWLDTLSAQEDRQP